MLTFLVAPFAVVTIGIQVSPHGMDAQGDMSHLQLRMTANGGLAFHFRYRNRARRLETKQTNNKKTGTWPEKRRKASCGQHDGSVKQMCLLPSLIQCP